MVIEAFPDVHLADPSGFLALGGDLEVESLLLSYKSGIFPWPLSDGSLAWFAPPRRAILKLVDFHIGRSLKKEIRRSTLTVTFNQDFRHVVSSCRSSSNRSGQAGTWITPAIERAYCRLHEAGYAFSVEAWRDTRMVGGLYGVSIGRFVAGESMFYLEENASKIAFYRLIERLRAHEVEWLDCQVMTPLFRIFGAKEVLRDDFMNLLHSAVQAQHVSLL